LYLGSLLIDVEELFRQTLQDLCTVGVSFIRTAIECARKDNAIFTGSRVAGLNLAAASGRIEQDFRELLLKLRR
jgi:hypothetical protein